MRYAYSKLTIWCDPRESNWYATLSPVEKDFWDPPPPPHPAESQSVVFPPTAPKTLDRRLCTGRSQEAVLIFLFSLEALFPRNSRVLLCAVSSSPETIGCYWPFQWSNPASVGSTAIRPVYNPLLSTCGPWENTAMLKSRHPHCVPPTFYLMSLPPPPPLAIHLINHIRM